MNQYEPVNLHDLMQGLSPISIPCLSMCSDSGGVASRRTSADISKTTAIAQDLVYWLFSDYLVPLLRVSFVPVLNPLPPI